MVSPDKAPVAQAAQVSDVMPLRETSVGNSVPNLVEETRGAGFTGGSPYSEVLEALADTPKARDGAGVVSVSHAIERLIRAGGLTSGTALFDEIAAVTKNQNQQVAGHTYEALRVFAELHWNDLSAEARNVFMEYEDYCRSARAAGRTNITSEDYEMMLSKMRKIAGNAVDVSTTVRDQATTTRSEVVDHRDAEINRLREENSALRRRLEEVDAPVKSLKGTPSGEYGLRTSPQDKLTEQAVTNLNRELNQLDKEERAFHVNFREVAGASYEYAVKAEKPDNLKRSLIHAVLRDTDVSSAWTRVLNAYIPDQKFIDARNTVVDLVTKVRQGRAGTVELKQALELSRWLERRREDLGYLRSNLDIVAAQETKEGKRLAADRAEEAAKRTAERERDEREDARRFSNELQSVLDMAASSADPKSWNAKTLAVRKTFSDIVMQGREPSATINDVLYRLYPENGLEDDYYRRDDHMDNEAIDYLIATENAPLTYEERKDLAQPSVKLSEVRAVIEKAKTRKASLS